jgi:Rrf2 family protein
MLTALVGYAATALGYLAQRGAEPVQVHEIARERDIPAPFLSKIIRVLSAKGIVATRRGTGGGVTLVADPERLTLLALCRELDEPLEPQCLFGQEVCDDRVACPAHAAMKRIRSQQLALLESLSIRQIGELDARRHRAGRIPARVRRKKAGRRSR